MIRRSAALPTAAAKSILHQDGKTPLGTTGDFLEEVVDALRETELAETRDGEIGEEREAEKTEVLLCQHASEKDNGEDPRNVGEDFAEDNDACFGRDAVAGQLFRSQCDIHRAAPASWLCRQRQRGSRLRVWSRGFQKVASLSGRASVRSAIAPGNAAFGSAECGSRSGILATASGAEMTVPPCGGR